ncbi:hypothetical protein GP486_006497 [Trichoglossum hirsutum]|uniref:Uncharacterized protein n=1 Tax=Trichoglossum hirsutum TaxID=265104 RepID=A0A9P8L7F2_9PEZI|nr:hypothetical protein GP486_006497 [Trichoglossum hirsutum]
MIIKDMLSPDEEEKKNFEDTLSRDSKSSSPEASSPDGTETVVSPRYDDSE